MMRVRPAQLDDTAAISGLLRADVRVWQRLDSAGRVQDVPYDRLTLYERWLHGTPASAPWMSIETGAIWLNHLSMGAGMPLVAVAEDRESAPVVGYAEAFINNEPAPFGVHLHLSVLAADAPATATALLTALIDRGRRLGAGYVTCTRPGTEPGDMLAAGIAGHTPTPLETVYRYTLPARTGQIFYQTVDHPDADPLQISGWGMPCGRAASPRQTWEMHWPPLFAALTAASGTAAGRAHRLHLTTGGLEAFVLAQPGLYDPRLIEMALWAPQTTTPQMISALRDWAHRTGYRTLSLIMTASAAASLGPGAEMDAYQHETIGIPVLATPPR